MSNSLDFLYLTCIIFILYPSLIFLSLDTCVPYSQEACLDAGRRLNLEEGGGGYDFAGDYLTQGCYAYDSSHANYPGTMYYGTGGTTEQMQESLEAPMYRPKGYDCSGTLGGK